MEDILMFMRNIFESSFTISFLFHREKIRIEILKTA